MIEISLAPVKSISVDQFETHLAKSLRKLCVAFADKAGNIHALDRDMYGVRFLPIATANTVPIMFDGEREEELIAQALRSGYRVFWFNSIGEMVKYFTTH